MGTYQDLYERLKKDPEALQEEIAKAVGIDREVMLTDILRQSQHVPTWGYILALAEKDAKVLEDHLEEDILPPARFHAESEIKKAGRKVTVGAIDDIAKSDPGYKMVRSKLVDAQLLVSILKRSAVKALEHKLQMLQSLNSRQKSELETIPGDDAFWRQPKSQDPIEQRFADYRDTKEPTDVEQQVRQLARIYRSKRRK